MEYPKINLSLEALKARDGEQLQNEDLPDFKFQIDVYRPGIGGSGHFHGEGRAWNFRNMDELCDIVVNQMALPPQAFFYQDALATCNEIEQDLRQRAIKWRWKDELIVSDFTGRYPARARICYLEETTNQPEQALAVLRDGTTIDHFRLWEQG